MPSTTKIAMIMEYDGTHYHGFQLQGNLPTIQRETEEALWKLTGERRRVIAASRTDAGVHAKGQVVSFRTNSTLSTRTFRNGLNFHLPAGVAVTATYRISDSFDVRRRAISREYRYYILNRPARSPIRDAFSHHVIGQLDVDAMNEACQVLLGEHDFASFASCLDDSTSKTIRTVYQARVERKGDMVIFNMVANSFLPHQVRNTVGALIQIGLGRSTAEELRQIMDRKRPGLAGPAAPPCGLFLMQVNYPQPFEGDAQ